MGPCISSLMVTQPGREAMARRAIACWQRQTYPRKELVIVCDGSRELAERFAQEVPEARIDHAPPGTTLGELRNRARELATGDVVCQWDDDDQYHPRRLEIMWRWMNAQEADACFLTSQFHYFANRLELYVRSEGKRGIEGTVMHRNDLQVRYPSRERSEDELFMYTLVKHYRTTTLAGHAWLYLRVFHGKNTWDETHHACMMRHAYPKASLQSLRAELEQYLEPYELQRPLTVCGSDGMAFVL